MATENNNNHLYLGFFVLVVLAYLYYTRFFDDKNKTDIDNIKRGLIPKNVSPEITSNAASSLKEPEPIMRIAEKTLKEPETRQITRPDSASRSSIPTGVYIKGRGVSENTIYEACPPNFNDLGMECSNQFKTFYKKTIDRPYDISTGSTIPDPGPGLREWTNKGKLFYPKCPSDKIDLGNACWPTSTRFYSKGDGVYEDTLYTNMCQEGYINTGVECINFQTNMREPHKKQIKSQDQLLYSKSTGSTIPDPGPEFREWIQNETDKYYPKCPSDMGDIGTKCVYI